LPDAFVVSGVQGSLTKFVIAAPVWVAVAATPAVSLTPLIATPLIATPLILLVATAVPLILLAAKLFRLLSPQLFLLLATVTIILIRISPLSRCD